MPAKTKYRKQRNRTRRRNNRTRRYRHKPRHTSNLAKQMNGGTITNVDNKQEQETETPLVEQYQDTPNVQDIPMETMSADPAPVPSSEPEHSPIPVEKPIEEPHIDNQPPALPSQEQKQDPEYKYNNILTGEDILDGIEKISISKEDMERMPKGEVSIIGTNVPNTNYYIDQQGIRREFNKDTKEIWKVLIAEMPNVDSILDKPSGENKLLNEATAALNSLEAVLQQMYVLLPQYMEVDFAEKRYVISKETPYIIVDKY